MGTEDKPTARRYVRIESVDWADDEAIETLADVIWERMTMTQQGEPMSYTQSPATTDGLIAEGPGPVVLTQRYADAVAYAAILHGTDVRKGTQITYLCHLLGVSGLVLEAEGDEDQAIAGLLHDAVEDAGGLPRARDIAHRFGEEVAQLVLDCSDSTDEAWKASVDYWDRKQAYLDHLEHQASDRAVLVSMADKVHNARALVTDLERGGMAWKFNGTPELVVRYYTELLRIAQARGVVDTLTIPFADAVATITGHLDAGGTP